ncbi:MAG: sel1 repeat family protein, partial [Lentisphaerae bacterium]
MVRLKLVCLFFTWVGCFLVLSGCLSIPRPRSLRMGERLMFEEHNRKFARLHAQWLNVKDRSDAESRKKAEKLLKAMEEERIYSPMAKYFFATRLIAQNKPESPQFARAVHWLEEAVEEHYLPAMTFLGKLYMDGAGVTRSTTKGFRLFLMAATRGDPDAMYNLGMIYALGYHGRRSDEDAIYWFQKANAAKDLKDPYCWQWLGMIYLRRSGSPQDLAMARKCLERAAAAGLPQAMFFLGVMLKRGLGGPVDVK